MSILMVILLGAVQGITEFLPVSSSGHLAFLQTLLGWDAGSPEMLLFDLAVHIGTLLAVVIVLAKSIPALLSRERGVQEPQDDLNSALTSVNLSRLFWMVMVATVATGLLVMPIKKQFTQAFGSLTFIALMWIVTGTLLWATDRRKQSTLNLKGFGLKGAFLVGLAQGVAVMPGISRSGATVCLAILLGLQRTGAVAFSLLIGIPAVLGASLVESLDEWQTLKAGHLPVGYLLLGGAVATGVGVVAIELLVRFARAAQLKYFGFYCYALAGAAFLYLLMR